MQPCGVTHIIHDRPEGVLVRHIKLRIFPLGCPADNFISCHQCKYRPVIGDNGQAAKKKKSS